MSQDTLHQINDIYIALGQLRNEIKPVEKSSIEKYGVIIGASIAASISIIITLMNFYLTRNKDNKKDDKAIRSKIFSDISEIEGEFKDAILERDLHLVNVNHYANLMNIKDVNIAPVKLDFVASSEKYREFEAKVNALELVYFAKVFNYLFHKETKTEVTQLQKRLRGVGLNFKTDLYESANLTYCTEFLKVQIQKCKMHHSTEVITPMGMILDAIIRNE